MDIIFSINDNVEPYDSIFVRKASRAVIIKDSKILMIQSKKYGEFKFPGGGLRFSENQIDALKREVLEETGKKVDINSIEEFGMAIEEHPSNIIAKQLFRQESYYFTCNVSKGKFKRHLDLYEKEYGYEPLWVTLDEAIKQNELLAEKNIPEIQWVKRELGVLKYIKNLKGENV